MAELQTNYPQGGEKQLIYAITRREVPKGALPIATGCIVSNVSTAAAVCDAIETGMPLVKRAVTVTGAVMKPSNLILRIGTPYQEIIDFCGGFKGEPTKIISGGPMMGIAVTNTDVPTTKGTSGITIFSAAEDKIPEESNCLRCGRCVDICPMGLSPQQLNMAYLRGRVDLLQEYDAMSCINCGSCTYICPAKRNLAQSINLGKKLIAKAQKK